MASEGKEKWLFRSKQFSRGRLLNVWCEGEDKVKKGFMGVSSKRRVYNEGSEA